MPALCARKIVVVAISRYAARYVAVRFVDERRQYAPVAVYVYFDDEYAFTMLLLFAALSARLLSMETIIALMRCGGGVIR